MKKKFIFIYMFSIVVVFGGIYITLVSPGPSFDEENKDDFIACTMDAKMCPDGSYVGRSGPKCEFAKCPNEVTGSVEVERAVLISGIKVTPVKVISDSRCPEGVQCIWAGTVVVDTKLEKDGVVGQTMSLELGKPVTFNGLEIILVEVTPYPKQNDQLNFIDYKFTYSVNGVKKSI